MYFVGGWNWRRARPNRAAWLDITACLHQIVCLSTPTDIGPFSSVPMRMAFSRVTVELMQCFRLEKKCIIFVQSKYFLKLIFCDFPLKNILVLYKICVLFTCSYSSLKCTDSRKYMHGSGNSNIFETFKTCDVTCTKKS